VRDVDFNVFFNPPLASQEAEGFFYRLSRRVFGIGKNLSFFDKMRKKKLARFENLKKISSLFDKHLRKTSQNF
jgi:hypothetical protein